MRVFFLLMLLSLTSVQSEVGTIADLSSRLEVLSEKITGISQQLTERHLYLDEQTRADGNSGLKQQRVRSAGTKSFHSETFSGQFFADFHDHPNFISTLGLGEVIVVMNGVEFRTRHNDYDTVIPSKTSTDYHATDRLPFPDVPQDVTGTVEEQVAEMREYFRAFMEQNITIKDYVDYFKPVLAYIEGAWTLTGDEVEEPFYSTRHKIEAKTWADLVNEVLFLSYSGAKHSAENNAFLPRMIYNFTEDGKPIYAQWNYRILCHPLSFDLPTNRLRVEDDLSLRIQTNLDQKAYELSTRARFKLNPDDVDTFTDTGKFPELLDKIMREVPGKDNYLGNLQDDGFDGKAVDKDGKLINSAYYHRRYGLQKKGSSAIRGIREKGFSDPYIYMAMTSQSKVMPMRDKRCKKDRCGQAEQRWTYAIPLEIFYLTPLHKWNPYDIEDKGEADSAKGQTVSGGGQTGTFSKPYNGVNSEKYFITPHQFFYDDKKSGAIYVKNKRGEKCATVSAGFRVISPGISKMGRVRLRYPIAPIFVEGSVAWKELEALKTVVLEPQRYQNMFYEPLVEGGIQQGTNTPTAPMGDVLLVTKKSVNYNTVEHVHTVLLTRRQVERLKNTGTIVQESSFNDEHTHQFKLKYKKIADSSDECDSTKDVIIYEKCDGLSECWDEHPKCFNVKEGVL